MSPSGLCWIINKIMVQKIHPRGVICVRLMCEKKLKEIGSSSVHILRSPWIYWSAKIWRCYGPLAPRFLHFWRGFRKAEVEYGCGSHLWGFDPIKVTMAWSFKASADWKLLLSATLWVLKSIASKNDAWLLFFRSLLFFRQWKKKKSSKILFCLA